MEFLDKLVLPQSSEHLELLHYISILLMTILIPYLSLIFGGTILSLNYFRKSYSNSNIKYLQFAKDILQIVSINNLTAVALGILPFFTLILIYSQIFHKTSTHYTTDLFLAFLFVTVGLLFIYTFRLTFLIDLIFKNVEESSISEISKQDYSKIKNSSAKILPRYGYFGIVFLFAGIWIFMGVLASASNFQYWQAISFISMIFSLKTIIYLLLFIAFSFALTGSFVLFYALFWNKDNYQFETNYKEFFITTNSRLVYYSALFIPFFMLVNIYLIPKVYLSGNIFVFAFFVLLFVLIALSLNHYILNKSKLNYNPIVFFFLVLAVFSLIIQKEVTIKTATEGHSLVLSEEYNKLLAELKGNDSEVVINAAEIYQVKCAACHQFDQKLVGPAHLDVLPKYEGKLNQLISFIRNPVKVDPSYPPMPNPGLKPKEAEAVAQFLLDEFQKRKK